MLVSFGAQIKTGIFKSTVAKYFAGLSLRPRPGQSSKLFIHSLFLKTVRKEPIMSL